MDIEKIKKAKKGDDQSFYELITEHRELLYKTAYLYVKNEQDALDIVGETVYHAFRSIGKLKRFDQLAEPYKTVVILKYLHDLPNGQIAEILDTPVGTVKTHLHRALKKLKAYIGGKPNHEF
jgi:RNA polymerase sigma-70 factor (ECF subfamily)